jgi:hypothetical protein
VDVTGVAGDHGRERSPARPLWSRLVRPVVLVAALVLVFAWVLLQFIGHGDVWLLGVSSSRWWRLWRYFSP